MIRVGMEVSSAVLAVLTQWLAAPSARPRPRPQDTIITGNLPPTAEQVRSLSARTVENQHRNDRAMEEFERVERVVTHKPGENSDKISDRTDRILPSRTGIMKLQVAENGSPSPRYFIGMSCSMPSARSIWPSIPMSVITRTLSNSKSGARSGRFGGTAVKAFRITWAGRETRGSRTLDEFLLDLTRTISPSIASRLRSNTSTLRFEWTESQAQFARVEGDIASDITFGGGIAGKIYHGGTL